jgi:hypothetical protein
MFYRETALKASPGKGRWHEVPERFSIAALLRMASPGKGAFPTLPEATSPFWGGFRLEKCIIFCQILYCIRKFSVLK